MHGKELNKAEPRTDFYLPIPGKDDISIKLREGDIEIKQRTGTQTEHHLTTNTLGFLEDWVKWSFDLKEHDDLVHNIIKHKKFDWFEVYKERIGFKYTSDNAGRLNIVDIKERPLFGCQIEYTRLKIYGKEWFTFGLEWFGDNKFELPDDLLNKVLGDTKLELKDSKGYNAFLNGQIF